MPDTTQIRLYKQKYQFLYLMHIRLASLRVIIEIGRKKNQASMFDLQEGDEMSNDVTFILSKVQSDLWDRNYILTIECHLIISVMLEKSKHY